MRGAATAVVTRRSPANLPPLFFLPPDLNGTSFETQYMSHFWDLYFPANHALPKSKRNGLACCNWTLDVQKMDVSDSALKPAILSLCLARIGEDRNDRRVSEHAMKLYGTALKEMNRALQDSKRIHTDEILAAGKLMSQCSTAPPRLSSRHVARIGKAMFVALYGSWSFVEHLHEPTGILVSYSSTLDVQRCILTAIVSRKPNSFTAPQWQTPPLEAEPEDLSESMYDILALLPALFERFDSLEDCRDGTRAHDRRLKLFHRCYKIDLALCKWYAFLSTNLPKPLPSAIRLPAKVSNASRDDTLFLFEDSDLSLGVMLTFHWATCNLLHSLMHTLFAAIQLKGGGELPRRLPEHVNPIRSAASIAQSVEYFIRPEMGILGPELFAFPLGVALLYFRASTEPGAEEEQQRLEESVAKMSDIGPSLEAFLTSLQAAMDQ
ncbi:MAG: hypothetical protein Q9194_000650 [Teloschistes cf. exilis]